jgi:hypothetical protein
MANDAHIVSSDQLFAAGDVRANENIELTALQTLFVREHNYWAGQISKQNPQLSDEAIYQRARAIVVGEMQAITYNEWLPALMGQNAVKPYAGYNANVNPGIANEFSTAEFRFGHSMLGDDVEFLDNNGQDVRGEVSLAQAFFNPNLVASTGIDPIVKYLASDPASEIDTKVVDSVRNFLFGPPGSGGLDLASLNIERGRDNGIADYNTARAAYGLPKVTQFSQITSDPQLQAQLKQLYGNVNNIDLWVGGLAEDHVKGSSLGPTFQAIIADQFTRLRDGDRFWYQNQFSGPMLQQISQTSLSDIIKRNTTDSNLQENVFQFKAGISGMVVTDLNKDGKPSPQEPGAAGVKVDLIEKDTGDVVASTTTDPQGRYMFDVEDGLRTGVYQVRVQLPAPPSGAAGATILSAPIAITRGDQFVDKVTLAIPPKPAPKPSGSTSSGSQIAATKSSGSATGGDCDSGASGSHSGEDSRVSVVSGTQKSDLRPLLATQSKDGLRRV